MKMKTGKTFARRVAVLLFAAFFGILATGCDILDSIFSDPVTQGNMAYALTGDPAAAAAAYGQAQMLKDQKEAEARRNEIVKCPYCGSADVDDLGNFYVTSSFRCNRCYKVF